uniref:Retrovirus-related Pol polyprotein from transposon TNT 1-94 n=2 Tax=Cajanus cajan TaxID=3821 RepID=A0A151SCF1_CAJCA|nr:Retrovirus-related Pol polyprotein from transposon TNT 1-94 [Cajanus cajan]KYP52429.1 Retrovirus-related Pol polyprotein from transposon TNT 1-94 [Cajanus cajan]
MTTMKLDVPLFDGRIDFSLWQCTIQDYLVQQGLDCALEEEKPCEMKDSEWSTIQKKAVSTIRLALAPQIKVTVLKETSPRKLWNLLEGKFASTTLTNRLMMKMDLYSLKMEDEGNVFDHINKFNELVSRLMNAGETIKDEEQALLILASLPKSYKSLVQSLLAGKSTLLLDEVIRALKENQQMMGGDKSSGDSQILLAKGERGKKYGDQHGRRFQPKDMSNIQCHYCGEFGHIQFKCPEFKEDLKCMKEKKKSTPSVSVACYDDGLM